MKKFVVIIIIYMGVFSLSAAYVTAVAGDDVYIIDERSGEVLWRIREGEMFSVGYGTSGNEYPMKTISSDIPKYEINVDIEAKFTEENVYLHMEISPNYWAYDYVLEELVDEGAVIIPRFFDSDGFFLGEEELNLSGAVNVRNSDDDIVMLTVDKIADGSEALMELVDNIDFVYRIGSSVTPSDLYFATTLTIPEWLQHSYYCFEEDGILNFSLNDIVGESLDGSWPVDSIADNVTEEKRWAYQSEGIEPEDYFRQEVSDDSFALILDEDVMEFHRTDNPYLVELNYGDDYSYPMLRTDYRCVLDDIPLWLIGSWSYCDEEIVEITENDIVIDGKSLTDELANATIETYIAIGEVITYIDTESSDNSFTLRIGELNTIVTMTANPDVIEVSGALVQGDGVATLTRITKTS